MKKISIIISLVLFSIISYSQEIEKFELIDSTKGVVYEIEKGHKMSVKTSDIVYKGEVNDITNEQIVIDNYKIPWNNIESVNFKDKKVLKSWMSIVGVALAANAVLTTIVLATDNDGYGGMVLILITAPALGATAVIAGVGYAVYNKGRTIRFKPKK